MTPRRTALLLGLALLCACLGGLRRAPPEKQRFMLQVEPPPAVAPAAPDLLRLERVRVSPVFDHKSFVYRLSESRFDTDFYHEFFSPPGVLLQEALRRWLEAAGPLRLAERGAPAARWLLETELEQLFADRRAAGAPRAVLQLGVRLIDTRTGKPALEKDYSAEERAADDSPDALVAAWNRGLAALLGTLSSDLHGVLTPSARHTD